MLWPGNKCGMSRLPNRNSASADTLRARTGLLQYGVFLFDIVFAETPKGTHSLIRQGQAATNCFRSYGSPVVTPGGSMVPRGSIPRPSSTPRQVMLAAVDDLTSPLVRCNVLRALKFGAGALHLAQAWITHTTKIAQCVAADGAVSLMMVAMAWSIQTHCRPGVA